MSEFGRGKIVPYLEYGLSFDDNPVALVDTQPVSCEYGINGLKRVILDVMQDFTQQKCVSSTLVQNMNIVYESPDIF